jgi:spore germination cell wall hydrolase CwlJ-like protein
MEALTKDGAARYARATPARNTDGQPANGSRDRIIARKKRRAKYRRRRLTALLILLTLIFALVYIVVTAVTADQPTVDQNTTITEPLASQWPAGYFPTIVTQTQQTAPAVEEPPTPRYALTDAERDVVERVVMAEAGGESFEGQMLVAQCILNAAEKSGTAPSEAVVAYKYTTRRPEPTQSVRDAVAAVFDDGETVTDEPILYFYNPAIVSSSFHESQIFVIEVGGHRFFAERSPE